MTRLPVSGSDDGVWGTLLNDFLMVSHDSDGALKAGSINENQLSQTVQTKLNSGGSGSNVASVNGRSGTVSLTASDVGLSAVSNTSDAAKPVSTATQAALDTKASISHSHAIADITSLQTALNAKADITAVGNKVMVYNSYADAPALPVNTVVISISGA